MWSQGELSSCNLVINWQSQPWSGSVAIPPDFDIAPHLEPSRLYRALRNVGEAHFRNHDGRALFWRTAIPALLIFWALALYGLTQI